MIEQFIGIDPGQDGGAAVLEKTANKELILRRTVSFRKSRNWAHELLVVIEDFTMYGPHKIVLERVHSMTGNGAKSSWSFAENNGAIKAVLQIANAQRVEPLTIIYVEPTDWPLVIGLPKHRSVVDPRKRREARRVSQEQWAKALFPGLANWNAKEEGDIYAAVLIAFSQYRRQFSQAENIELASSLPH